jgi:hypothetical protein
MDKQIISNILHAPVELDTCLADGDDCCTYHVKVLAMISEPKIISR